MKCVICGKTVKPSGSNFMLKDDKPMHKRCPKPRVKLSEQESEQLEDLKQAILRYANNKPKGYMVGRTLNWARTMVIVNVMHEKGYSYLEIKYALDKVVDEMDGFWGIGAVNNRIDAIIAKKRDIEEKSEMYKENKNVEDSVDLKNLISVGWGEEW